MTPRSSKPTKPATKGRTYPHAIGTHVANAARERARAVRLTTLRLVRDSSFVVTIEVSEGADGGVPRGDRAAIRSPRDVYELMAPYAEREVGESFWILPLDPQHRLAARGPRSSRGAFYREPRAPAGGVPRRHRRERGGHRAGAQPPERRPDAVAGGPRRDGPTGRRRGGCSTSPCTTT